MQTNTKMAQAKTTKHRKAKPNTQTNSYRYRKIYARVSVYHVWTIIYSTVAQNNSDN